MLRKPLLVASLLVAGCFSRQPSNDPLIAKLATRGPVPLSSDNPYLAANLLLSRKMEGSEELRGFVKHRGTPQAIEVNSAQLLKFYYPEAREYFTLENDQGLWIINGPFSLDRDKARQLAKLTRTSNGEARLETPKIIEEHGRSDQPLPVSTPAVNPSSAESELPALVEKLKGPDAQEAEISPRGDIVHYVTYPGETLSMLARWYTLDRSNAGRIARINNLTNPNALRVGDSIIIPSYLVKNKARLQEEAVKELGVVAKRQ